MQEAPRWSPDGTQLAYVDYGITEVVPCEGSSWDADSVGVWVLDIASGIRTRVSRSADRDFTWSPDGRKLLFSGPDGGLLITVDGGQIDTIRAPRVMVLSAWSPGGDSIAYNEGGTDKLFVLNLRTSVERYLTRLMVGAEWSPDGRYLAGPHGYLFDFAVGTRRELWAPGTFSSVWHFDWCPDGQRIVFHGVRRAGSIDLWVLRMPETELAGPILRHALDPTCNANGHLAYVDIRPENQWTKEYGRVRIIPLQVLRAAQHTAR
jgi:Tol biopolymer transport system component